MSRLSIYETSWINLVFENKNKEYGAYQLRQESSRITLLSFFVGILLISTFGGIYKISSLLENPIVVEAIPTIDEPIIVTTYIAPPKIIKTPVNTSQTKTPKEPKVFAPMVVSQTPDMIVDIPTNKDILENHPTNLGTEGGAGTANPSTGTIGNPTLPIDLGTTIVATTALDKLPEFPGGMEKFYKYVGNNFEKPEIEGISAIRVSVSFVIEKDGTMTDIQVKKDPGYGLGKEAIRVLKSLRTKWSPGMIGSKPVRTSYNLPITVQID